MKRVCVVATICLLVCATGALAAETAVYSIHANVRAALTFPASEGIQTVEYLAPEDELRPVPVVIADDGVSFTVTPRMMPDGGALLVINRPPGLSLSDREPPRIVSVSIDGVPAQPAESVLLQFQPRQVAVGLADASGIGYSGLRVSANGERVARGSLCLTRTDRGRQWTVLYTRPDGIELRRFSIGAEDRSLLANRSAFLVSVERGLEVLEDDRYSGGKAVCFATQTAFVAVKLTLPVGEYEIEAVGHAPDSGTNSWHIELDGARQTDVMHIPEVEAGTCSRTVEIDPELLPRLRVSADGEHVLALTLREGPGPVLDRLRILRDGREVAAYEGEDILPRFPRP